VTGDRPEVVPAAAFGEHVAGLLADRLAARPSLVVCLPTGSTPLPAYAALPGVLARRGVDASAATVVLLDEYLGLPAGHVARCDATLRRRLLDGLAAGGVGRPRLLAFDVDEAPPDVACARLDAAIETVGGLDLVVLGLGANGHVGMNEPGTSADAPTRMVELAPSTREASIAYGATEPPTHGVTLGMATILAAREVWLLASGAHKAAILAATLDGPVTTAVPASLLRDHPGLRVIADDTAARAA
jgi:glucosamine-6-phosphate deaminase